MDYWSYCICSLNFQPSDDIGVATAMHSCTSEIGIAVGAVIVVVCLVVIVTIVIVTVVLCLWR